MPQSNRAKGRVCELRAKEKLESEGYICYLAPMSRMWQKYQDFFLFDIVAIRKHQRMICEHQFEHIEMVSEKRFVQVKLNRGKGVFPSLKKFKDEYLDKLRDTVELWVWSKKKRAWNIKVY